MMGKTHVAMGMATSLVILMPKNPPELICAIAGGALGGVLADIDILDHDYKNDALIGQLIAYFIFCVCMFVDYYNDYGICVSLLKGGNIKLGIGAILFVILYIMGFMSKHRTFTHSLIAMALFSFAIGVLFCKLEIVIAFAVGYCSHLVLDITNKKPVPLLYPKKKGICLKLFYASKFADKVFMWTGFVLTGVMTIVSVIK